MSIVTIQVGQCGNQIGDKLFDTLISDCYEAPQTWSTKKALDSQKLLKNLNIDYVDESKKRFFAEYDPDVDGANELRNRKNATENATPTLYARSVLVDMESKVVNKLLRKKTPIGDNLQWRFRESNSFTQKKGSGNNWSYGYCVNGPKCEHEIMDKIRREVERCDRLGGFMPCLSLAGGTGSGVGAFLTECIRSEYPRSTIVNPVVWPYTSGEVIIQNYNFVLTLSKLYECSDALIIFENDQLHEICTRIMDAKKVGFDDLNGVIAHKLASVLQPASKPGGQANYLDEIVTDLCANDYYKLLSLNNVPQLSQNSIEFGAFQWPGLYKQGKQLLSTGWFMEEGMTNKVNQQKNKSIGVALFARGLALDMGLNSEFFPQNSNQLFSPINNPLSFGIWTQKREFNGYNKSLTLLSNSQSPVYKIDSLMNKAWGMFTSRAYVHQYLKHGYEEEKFLNSFLFVEQLIKRYMSI